MVSSLGKKKTGEGMMERMEELMSTKMMKGKMVPLKVLKRMTQLLEKITNIHEIHH
jgi:hypothetical protein